VKLAVEAITNLNAVQVLRTGADAIRGGDAVIDFSAVTRCDSAAVACVLAWLRTARGAGRELRLVSVPPDLTSLARLYGVESLIPLS